jgi:hypothetical protein
MLPFVPWDQLQEPPPVLLWEFGLSPYVHSQPLCLSQPLLDASSSSGNLACCPTSAFNLCCFSHVSSLRIQHCDFGSLPHPHSPGKVQHTTPTSSICVRLKFTFYVFQFCCRNSVCPGTALDYVPRVWVGESHMVCDAHLFFLQIHSSSIGVGWQSEMALLFSV